MASQERGRPLPKFGEWDVNNPASAEGFTVIFNKARAEKKTTAMAAAGAGGPILPRERDGVEEHKKNDDCNRPPKSKKKWFCFG